MKKIIKHIPNCITLMSLFSGCFAIIYAFNFDFKMAFWLIIAAAIFDFADGFVARLLHAQSEMGLQLDSIVDMVSFGVAPSVIVYSMFNVYGGVYCCQIPIVLISGVSFFIAAGSALRLAKFNIDPNQKEYFIGLPTPANALFFAGLPFLFSWLQNEICNKYLTIYLIVLVVLMSYLLVSKLPMFSLKVKHLNWCDNKLQIVFILLSVLLVFFIHSLAVLPLLIVLYIIISALFFKADK